MKKVLVTGANGFIGRALCKRLVEDRWSVTAAIRQPETTEIDHRIRLVKVRGIDERTNWGRILEGIDIIVHLAARVHILSEHAIDPLDAFRRVNVKGTVKLAQKASGAGVRRFIYLSSVKVNGEGNKKAYNEENAPQPEDPYGISKMEGEIEVEAACNASDMEWVAIRPPLVYGAGVKANFRALMNLVHKRIPLPLATVRNRRSFIYLGNLVDSIITCMTHHAAAGRTYLVSDDRDVSTPELIRLIAASLNTPSYLFPFPPSVLWFVGKLLGKADTMKRLIGSLSVDISKIKNELSWQPPFSMESGLMNTAKWYKRG